MTIAAFLPKVKKRMAKHDKSGTEGEIEPMMMTGTSTNGTYQATDDEEVGKKIPRRQHKRNKGQLEDGGSDGGQAGNGTGVYLEREQDDSYYLGCWSSGS